jgi:hypothetical protein
LAVAFHLVGFAVPPQPVSCWTSLLYAFRATLSLTDNEVTLTALTSEAVRHGSDGSATYRH